MPLYMPYSDIHWLYVKKKNNSYCIVFLLIFWSALYQGNAVLWMRLEYTPNVRLKLILHRVLFFGKEVFEFPLNPMPGAAPIVYGPLTDSVTVTVRG